MTPEAREFLERIAQPGIHCCLVAIHPETQACIARGFTKETLGQAAGWATNHADHNLYWSVNPLKAPINKKPQKNDVAEMAFAHVDIDDASPEVLERLKASPLPPTIILFSGGGYQAFWKLRERIHVNGNISELEEANKALIAKFGGDKSAWNIDRIMRLPGTTNWPTKTKKKRGRVPVEAQLIEFDASRVYSFDDFTTFKTAEPQIDRSADLLRQIIKAVRAGRSDADIHTEFEQHPHAKDCGNPKRAVKRCIDKARATCELQPVTRSVAEIEAQPLTWLVPGQLPLGKLGMLAGDPGLGKSQVTIDLAAAVTSQSRHPWTGSMGGEVVLLNAEDDVADTVRPRLEAAGADLKKVFVLEAVRETDYDNNTRTRHFNLAKDVDALRSVLSSRPDARLVVIDPISAYLGGVDSHKNTDVRDVLAPLSALAAERRVTVLCVSHLNKGGSGTNALYRVTGSLAFVAAARFVLAVVRDDADAERRLLLPVKHNLAPTAKGHAYKVVEASGGVSRLEWESNPVAFDVDDALDSGRSAGRKERDREVEEWLEAQLADGPKFARDLWSEADSLGFSRNRVKRVKAALKLVASNEPDGWVWSRGPRQTCSEPGPKRSSSDSLSKKPEEDQGVREDQRRPNKSTGYRRGDM